MHIMFKRTISTIGALLLGLVFASGAFAAEKYAVVPLIGDELTVVTYQPNVGSNIDSNARQVIPIRDTSFDEYALRAVETVVHRTVPGSEVELLLTPNHDFYARETDLTTQGESLKKLLASIEHDFKDVDARYLILITKSRGDVRLTFRDGPVGAGKLAGLGFYVDRYSRVVQLDDGEEAQGFLAAYAYLSVSLIDRKTGSIVRTQAASETSIISSAVSKTTANPWDAVPASMKVAAVKDAIQKLVEHTVPRVVSPT